MLVTGHSVEILVFVIAKGERVVLALELIRRDHVVQHHGLVTRVLDQRVRRLLLRDHRHRVIALFEVRIETPELGHGRPFDLAGAKRGQKKPQR